MEYALPSSWGQGSRGFWTKRKKTATSLMAILALVAGIAVAYKLFDRTVPNNVVRDAAIFDFAVQVKRTPGQGCTSPVQGGEWCNALAGNPIFPATIFVQGTPRPVDWFPGDSRREEVRIINTNNRPPKDASFEVYVDQESIVVRGCDGIDETTGACTTTPEIDPDDERWTKFLNFWTLTISKEKVLHVLGQETYQSGQFEESCSEGLRQITPTAPCELGMIRAAGTTSSISSDRMDIRNYRFDMREEDDGTDQSEFKGWTITFDFVFSARVPAKPGSSAPVHER